MPAADDSMAEAAMGSGTSDRSDWGFQDSQADGVQLRFEESLPDRCGEAGHVHRRSKKY
jgi:hypothetical protein